MTRTNTGNAFRFFYFDPYSVSRTVKKQKTQTTLTQKTQLQLVRQTTWLN